MPKPEQMVQKAVLEWLTAKHIWAMRVQTGATVSEYKGKRRMFRFGNPGAADIFALLPCYDCQRGFIPLHIECKSNVGRQSELQKSFEKDVLKHGHRYVLARSVEDVENYLKEIS